MKKADAKKPAITITPADGQPAADPTSTAGAGKELNDFRFPDTPAGIIDPSEPLVTSAGDTLISIPITDPLNQTTEATEANTASTKTKSSKRDRAKRLQKRVVLKIRELGSRLKKRLQKGKRKMKPKTPARKRKVELDTPSAGLPHAAPAA